MIGGGSIVLVLGYIVLGSDKPGRHRAGPGDEEYTGDDDPADLDAPTDPSGVDADALADVGTRG